jgi:hypothetical protein
MVKAFRSEISDLRFKIGFGSGAKAVFQRKGKRSNLDASRKVRQVHKAATPQPK